MPRDYLVICHAKPVLAKDLPRCIRLDCHLPAFSQDARPKSQDKAIKSKAFREIDRPKQGLRMTVSWWSAVETQQSASLLCGNFGVVVWALSRCLTPPADRPSYLPGFSFGGSRDPCPGRCVRDSPPALENRCRHL